DEQVTWNTTDPDFTPCFQKTVLTWAPVAYLILLAPYKIYSLWNLQDRPIKWNWLNISKIVLSGLIAVLMAIQCIASVVERTKGEAVPPVNFISPLFLLLSMFLAIFFIYLERRRGIRTSGYLLIFWLLLLLTGIIIFRSKIRHAVLQGGVESKLDFGTFTVYFLLVIVSFVLSALVDKRPTFEEVQQDTNPCPEGSASFLSRISFWWFTGLVILGYKRALVRSDLWSLNKEDTTASVQAVYDKHWNAQIVKGRKTAQQLPNGIQTEARYQDGTVSTEVKVVDGSEPKKPSLLKTLVKSFAPFFFMAMGFKLAHDIMMFVSPQLLKKLIQFTTNKDEYEWRGYLYAALLFAVALMQSIVLHQYFHGCLVLGMRLRSVIVSAVYRKTLRMSNASKKTSTVGEIVNLMSVDAQRFMDLMTYFHTIWSGPFQICVSLYFLWQTLGPSVLAGVGVMVLLIPINALIAHKTRQLQVKQMTLKDSRIKLMNEVLNGIKVLKLYAWELSFQDKILHIRRQELEVLKKAAYLNACSSFAWTCAPFMVSLTTFAVYTLSDSNNILDAEKAFVSLSLFNIMRFPLSMLPNVITNIVQASVSLKRLQKFLDNEELDSDAVQRDPQSKAAVKIENGTFSWDRSDKDTPNTISNISLEVEEGSLVAVVGVVGAGKSSLLSAILGEMDKIQGSVSVKGSVAYVAQQAWIQNATVRDNILFNNEFNQRQYDGVIYSCALQQDLDMLPAGDETEIGEKGINLSGGQKQRVSLARATYSDTDIYLLDDPLSAVDSHVGKHIFDNVIGPEGLLGRKTRILVTHGIGFLPRVDKIVVLKDGQVSEVGTFTQLMDHNGAFAEFLKNYLTQEMDDGESPVDPSDLEALSMRDDIISHLGSIIDPSESAKLQRQITLLSERVRTESEMTGSTASIASSGKGGAKKLDRQVTVIEEGKNIEKQAKEDKLIQAESVETGRVKFSVFLAYLKAVGALLSLIIVAFYVLYNAASIYSNIWLSDWSNDARRFNGTADDDQRNMRLGVYGALGALQGVLVMACAWGTAVAGVVASRLFFFRLIQALLHCPMWFHEVTPVGRLMNRCCDDVAEIDYVVPFTLRSMANCVLLTIGTLAVIIYTTPLAACPLPFLATGYVLIQYFYAAPFAGVFIFAGTLIRTLGARNASRHLHTEFLANILRCPMHFFDVTPLGRIVNRFSKDIDAIDVTVPMNAHMFLTCFLHVLGTIVVISMGTPLFLSIILPLMILYYLVQTISDGLNRKHDCASCGVGSLIFSAALMVAIGSRQAARTLHHNMLVSVLRLPLTFFDTTPLGRIINRFSKDVDAVDVIIMRDLDVCLRCLFAVVGTITVIAMSTPIFLSVLVPLGIFYFTTQVGL
ncbi:hypothetical protein BaRGS_00002276, partial [Batillaria attramentaria]